MLPKKKEHPKEKSNLHPRNKHRQRYDFKKLIQSYPDLGSFVRLNEFKDESVDFFNPEAVKALNKALLKHYYGIHYWDVPKNYLIPPIPGRADYIHYAADLLGSPFPEIKPGKVPRGNKIKCLDIGVGANCVYPIIGHQEYGWSFVGADIDPVSVDAASTIVEKNASLAGHIDLRLQSNPKHVFQGIIRKGETFDLTFCNPPFHASFKEAQAGTTRKVRNLKNKKGASPVLNFGGQSNELWCAGGEERFVADMIQESKRFAEACFWFTTLLSKQSSLKSIYQALKTAEATEVRTIPMSQGNKASRMVAWTFLSKEQQTHWVSSRWRK